MSWLGLDRVKGESSPLGHFGDVEVSLHASDTRKCLYESVDITRKYHNQGTHHEAKTFIATKGHQHPDAPGNALVVLVLWDGDRHPVTEPWADIA